MLNAYPVLTTKLSPGIEQVACQPFAEAIRSSKKMENVKIVINVRDLTQLNEVAPKIHVVHISFKF
jgi:hypothetical protein